MTQAAEKLSMISYQILRQLVLEALKEKPRTQFRTIMNAVEKSAVENNVLPTEEECRERNIDYHYYQDKRLNPNDQMNVNQIIWDLIVDRILTVGKDEHNEDLPFLRLTELGYAVVEQTQPTYYDTDGYIASLRERMPNLDPIIEQYVLEGLHSFKQRLFFAAAVMFGAAAEKTILLLLHAIEKAETNHQREQKIRRLLERPNLPIIFDLLQDTLDRLMNAKTMPYSVHQGSAEHLLSLFEMIRVQRNDAVHPVAGQVSQTKIFLTIQTMPAALELVYRLMEWFTQNPI